MKKEMLNDLEDAVQSVALADQCRCDLDNGVRTWNEPFDRTGGLDKLPPSVLIGAGITAARTLINSYEANRQRIAELEAVANLYLDELRSVEVWAASISMQSQIEARINQVEKALKKAEVSE